MNTRLRPWLVYTDGVGCESAWTVGQPLIAGYTLKRYGTRARQSARNSIDQQLQQRCIEVPKNYDGIHVVDVYGRSVEATPWVELIEAVGGNRVPAEFRAKDMADLCRCIRNQRTLEVFRHEVVRRRRGEDVYVHGEPFRETRPVRVRPRLNANVWERIITEEIAGELYG
jgi:hypothetical protein